MKVIMEIRPGLIRSGRSPMKRQSLLKVTEESLYAGLEQAKAGSRMGRYFACRPDRC